MEAGLLAPGQEADWGDPRIPAWCPPRNSDFTLAGSAGKGHWAS